MFSQGKHSVQLQIFTINYQTEYVLFLMLSFSSQSLYIFKTIYENV